MPITGMQEFKAAFARFENEIERQFSGRLRNVVVNLHEEVMARTPVWTGEAVRNWQASVGSPAGGAFLAIGGPPDAALRAERTNSKPLGTEMRRPANEEAARASRAAVEAAIVANPYQEFWIANNAPHILSLEYGQIPSGPGKEPRTPAGGMLRLTFQNVLFWWGQR